MIWKLNCKTPKGTCGPTCTYELLILNSLTQPEFLLSTLTESRGARPHTTTARSLAGPQAEL